MSIALVTGGAGFIGSHIVDALIASGISVVVVDNLTSGKKENVNSEADFHPLDIRSPELASLFASRKIDWVFHLAAQIDLRKSVDDPVYDAQINIIGLLNLLENCRRNAVKGVIFASSGGSIYGEPAVLPVAERASKIPLSPYAVSKLTAENFLFYYHHVHGLPYIALRYSNVYGPRQSIHGEAGVIAIFTGKMLSGETPTIFGDGEQIRDYVFVEDVAKANLLAMRKLADLTPGTSIDDRGYNIATGIGTSVNTLYTRLQKCTGFAGKASFAPEKKGDLSRIFLDIRKAADELSWQPSVNLSTGLQKTVGFWQGSPRTSGGIN
jgi:UDP-glucose 4-epimerase